MEQLTLFGDIIDMQKLRNDLAVLRECKRAAETERAYAGDWRTFSGWCSAAGRLALPADPDTVCLFLAAGLSDGIRVSTLQRRLAAIADRHRAAAVRTPISTDVRAVLTAARRLRRERPVKKRALTGVQVAEAAGVLLDVGSVVAMRDRAILLLGFASSLRRSELVSLDLADLDFGDSRGVLVDVRRSKTDQVGAGRSVAVWRGSRPGSCPVDAVKDWLRLRGSSPGPLFVRVRASGRVTAARLSAGWIASVVKGSVAGLGLDRSRYAGHSLRAGFVTSAIEAGSSPVLVMLSSGHRSRDVFDGYVRPASLWVENPLAAVL